MRNLRKLLLLAITAIAAMAFAAPGASAQLQILDEATGDPCPAVSPSDSTEFPLQSTVTGGCVVHAINWEGSVDLHAHIFGIESVDSSCSNEFTARIGANGEGYLTNISLTGPACNRKPCDVAAGVEAWEIHGEETPTGERLEAHFCVERPDNTGRQTCHLFVPVREDLTIGTHRYEFGSVSGDEPVDIPCEGFTGFRAEVEGHWVTETDNIEIVH